MTTHAHARVRRGVLGRLAGRARRRPAPDTAAMKVQDFGDGPKITGFREQPRGWQIPAGYDTGYDHPGWEDDGRSAAELIDAIYAPYGEADIAEAAARPGHPPWVTAPQPALAGPGKLGGLYAAADLRDQRSRLASEYAAWYAWHAPISVPEGLVRQYAPEPAPAPVSYPLPSFPADLRDLPHFRATVRSRGWCGLATSFLPPALPDFALARFDHLPDGVAA